MAVRMTHDQEEIVRDLLAEGEYSSETQVIDAALVALRQLRVLRSAIVHAHQHDEFVEQVRKWAAGLLPPTSTPVPTTPSLSKSTSETDVHSIPADKFDRCLDRVISEWSDVLKRLA